MSAIDVVVPCYQYGRYLRDSVGSILSQKVDAIRVLIIDNASTDDTLDVAHQLNNEDKRVEVLSRKTNLGQHASYNEGIDWAAADYFMILDADDMLAPSSLTRAISLLDDNPGVIFCHGAEQRFYEGASLMFEPSALDSKCDWQLMNGTDFIKQVCSIGYNTIAWPTAVRRTSAQKQIGYYDPILRYADDMNMWLRLATLGNVAETKAVQGIRRVHLQQITASYRDNPLSELAAHLKNFEHFFSHEGASIPNAQIEAHRVTRKVASNAAKIGIKLLPKGQLRKGAECLDFAVRTWFGR